MTERPRDIVCIATRRLDNPMPTNVQHLMLRLAERRRVLYVEPPVDPVFLVRRGRDPRGETAVQTSNQMHVLSPIVLPWAHRSKAIAALNHRLLVAQIRRRRRRLAFERPLLWLFSPRQAGMIGRLSEAAVCYHITDDYRAMPGAATAAARSRLVADEQTVLQAARHVFITSRRLAEDRGLSGERFHVIPNVADVDHFGAALRPETRVAEEMAAIGGPIAGFVGAVDDYKIDFELLAAAARRTPEISWVLIGPVGWADPTTVPPQLRLPNVHLIGPRPYRSLPAYVKAFSVALIPYRINEYTRYCSPLKLYEYLAAGVGVVATDLPALREAGDLVTIASDPESFAVAVRTRLEDDDGLRRARIDLAARNSWSRRIEEIEAILCES